jgi:rare lipoprotein A
MIALRTGIAVLAVVGLALTGCSSKKTSTASMDPFAGTGSPVYKGSGKVPKGTGRQHVGKPYQIAGRWYTPKAQPGYDKSGTASWYGEAFHRRKTSNGEWFDMNELTAAHPTLPLPSYAKVTNLENGEQVVVRINDRGPFVGTRLIDLSKRTAEVLGFKGQGKANVRVQYLGPAPLRDAGQHLMAMNRELGQGASVGQLEKFAQGGSPGTTQVAAAPELRPTLANYEEEQAPETRTAAMGYVIRVASFADPENAAAASNSLTDYGARIVPYESDDGTMYRVVIGPVTSREQTAAALRAVNDAGYVDASVHTTRIQQVASN